MYKLELEQLRNNDKYLKELNLHNKGLTAADIQPLCQALEGNTNFQLHLGCNNLGAEEIKLLTEGLSKNIGLQALDLG